MLVQRKRLAEILGESVIQEFYLFYNHMCILDKSKSLFKIDFKPFFNLTPFESVFKTSPQTGPFRAGGSPQCLGGAGLDSIPQRHVSCSSTLQPLLLSYTFPCYLSKCFTPSHRWVNAFSKTI